MKLPNCFFFGFEARRDGYKLKHMDEQVANRAWYGSAPKAQFHLFCQSFMVACSAFFPPWLSGHRPDMLDSYSY